MGEGGLGRAAASGSLITLVGQGIKFVIQAVSIVVLARVLSPSDFGVYTMVAAIVTFSAVVGDFGLSYAAIQADKLSHKQHSNLFWLNVLIGAAGTLLTFVLAPVLAGLYGMRDIAPYFRVMSLSFILLALAVQPKALLTRNMKYSTLAYVDIGAQLAGLIGAILLAFRGFGAWALVMQQLIAYLVQVVSVFILARWVPCAPTRSAHIGRQVKFGLDTMAGSVVNYMSMNADKVLLGRTSSADELGVYGRMYQLFGIPVQQLAAPLTRVAVPTLSRLQGDPDRYNRFIAKAQRVSAYVFGITFAFVFAGAPAIVKIVLGDAWISGTPILRALVVGGLFQGLGYCYYWVFLSKARMDVQLRIGLVTRGLGVLAMVLGAQYGPITVAWCVSFMLFINWLALGTVGMRMAGQTAEVLLRPTARPLSLAVAVAISGTLVQYLLPEGGSVAIPLLSAACGGVVTILCAWCLSVRVRRDWREIRSLIAVAFSRRSV